MKKQTGQAQTRSSDLQEGKTLQDCSVPVVHLASHGLLNVGQGNAQQGERLLLVQPVSVEELSQGLTLACLRHTACFTEWGLPVTAH